MLTRQLNLLFERWWVLLIGLCVIAMGTTLSFSNSFRAAQGNLDHLDTWRGGLIVVSAGVAFIAIWSIPPIARWRRLLFGMQNLPFHHQATLFLGAVGPAVGTVFLLDMIIVMMADLPPQYAFVWPPDKAMMYGTVPLCFIFFIGLTCFTRERELKRRRRNNLCEVCAYGRVADEPQCNECGRPWHKRWVEMS